MKEENIHPFVPRMKKYSSYQGEISPSVLAATGEVFTFAGVCLGINYSYQFKLRELETKMLK